MFVGEKLPAAHCAMLLPLSSGVGFHRPKDDFPLVSSSQTPISKSGRMRRRQRMFFQAFLPGSD
jgi:hypothetical protein